MAETGYKFGTLNPVVYYENVEGRILLPPTTQDALWMRGEMRRRGFEYREADTLDKIDKLQKRMQQQEYDRLERDNERDERKYAFVRAAIRSSLRSRMISKGTSDFEKGFIKDYLVLKEHQKSNWRSKFEHRAECMFTLREYDSTKPIQDSVDNVPDMPQDTCKKCGKFRRVEGEDLCFTCLRNL